MKASTTMSFWCLGNRRLASGAVVALAKGGGHLALEDVSSNDVWYLGGGVPCLVRDGKRGSIFKVGAGFHGTANEDRCSRRVREQRRGHQTGGK